MYDKLSVVRIDIFCWKQTNAGNENSTAEWQERRKLKLMKEEPIG